MEEKANEQMKKVMITIDSFQSINGDGDSMELTTEGKYAVEADGIRFCYNESELTGLDGTVTGFLVKPEEVIMSRTGSVTTQMIFKCGQKQHFAYETPYGTLMLGLDTYKVEHSLDEHGGNMTIEYDLNFERSVVSRNRFKINVRDLKGN